jgi:hypothetical protein
MTDEERREAFFEWRRIAARNVHPSAPMQSERDAIMNGAMQPQLSTRLEWLEADASAQRTAILRLERAVFIHSCSVAIQGAAITWLIWKVLT